MELVGKRLLVLSLVLSCVAVFQVHSSHFRGGTISWKSEGGRKVHFNYRLGWTYGSGSGCQSSLIGQLVTGLSDSWECQSNNCGTNKLHDVNYYCTGANMLENWEQGENNFTFTFPSDGPFTIGFSGGDWITLSNGDGGDDWNIATTVDLRTRSDTRTPNSSPVSMSKPMYYVQYDCEIHLKLPVVDPDDDVIRCRWAIGTECESVCNALPGAYLEEETCTLVFNTTSSKHYTKNGIYAVALTIEDYPRVPISMGTSMVTPGDALSAVPLQFLVTTIPNTGSCDAGPRFVPPSPQEKQVITVEEGDTVAIGLYADNGNDTSAKANVITVSGILASVLSPVVPDVNHTNTFTTTLTWTPTHSDLGSHIVCADVENDNNKSGKQRCFVIAVVQKGCQSSPCQNSGKCLAKMGKYKCICRTGFTGHDCEFNVDDCVSNTCPPDTYCVDGINTYTCHNISTATIFNIPITTTEKNYTELCPLEYDHCDCTVRPRQRNKSLMVLSRQVRDVLGVSCGLPIGLVLSVITFFFLIRPCEKYCKKRKISQKKPFKTRRTRVKTFSQCE